MTVTTVTTHTGCATCAALARSAALFARMFGTATETLHAAGPGGTVVKHAATATAAPA